METLEPLYIECKTDKCDYNICIDFRNRLNLAYLMFQNITFLKKKCRKNLSIYYSIKEKIIYLFFKLKCVQDEISQNILMIYGLNINHKAERN